MNALASKVYRQYSPRFLRFLIFFILGMMIIGGALVRPLQAGVWDDLKEWYLVYSLAGGGQYVSYQRDVDSKDPSFPLEVLSDGYKMVRVYQDTPGGYKVEWAWRMTIKSKVNREVRFTLEYKLLDKDLFLVTSSLAPVAAIAPGQTVTVEKAVIMPYEKARPVESSNWYIQLK